MAPVLTVALLAAMGIANLRRPQPEDAEPYHRRVRDAAGLMPRRVGAWVGRDVPAPRTAVQLLKPNVLINRIYQNPQTGYSATLLLVQCKTARDMSGHFPPVCYPAHGWVLNDTVEKDWQTNGLTITGMEYGFNYMKPGDSFHKIIANFMIMPDGQIIRDIKGVRRAASDYVRHFFGAAQMQLVMDTAIPGPERDAIFVELIGANRDVIDVLRSGFEH